MKNNLFFFIIFLLFVINSKENIINNTVYNLVLNGQYVSYFKGKLQLLRSQNFNKNSNFKIKKNHNSLYNIQHLKTKLILITLPPRLDLILDSELKISKEWYIIETNDNKYIIQNNNKCYIYYNNYNFLCENIKKNDASKFAFIKIYEELNHNDKDLVLIEKEPIDVIIKYIDLKDPDLKREGIPQIKKDEDNEELRYCIRSVLKNIPWIRKIFIILPNKNVRYFKDYKLIREKIVYINDKDLIGFDSSNIYTFHFHYWRLKKYNVTENIIIMDDDYFIGKPLKKSDFFYVDKGKVVPALIASSFREQTKNDIKKNYDILKIKAKKSKRKQTANVYKYTIYNTYLFILKLLNKKSIISPFFTHNALPCNIKDIKIIYDLVNNSEFKSSTLDSIYRGIETLQFQSFYMTYTFNKNYNKKVSPISCAYIKHNIAINANYNYSLFVINTGGYNYSPMSFKKQRLAMEKIFPEPSPYEIINYSYFPSLALEIVNELDKDLKNCKKNIFKKKKNNINYYIEIFCLIIIIIKIFLNVYALYIIN